jgi:hypothetical protein
VPEDAKDPPFPRPVIRLKARGVIFTRIVVGRRETSMIIRLRPGWDAVAHFLETGAYDPALPPAALRRCVPDRNDRSGSPHEAIEP